MYCLLVSMKFISFCFVNAHTVLLERQIVIELVINYTDTFVFSYKRKLLKEFVQEHCHKMIYNLKKKFYHFTTWFVKNISLIIPWEDCHSFKWLLFGWFLKSTFHHIFRTENKSNKNSVSDFTTNQFSAFEL